MKDLILCSGEFETVPNSKLCQALIRMWQDNNDHAYISSSTLTTMLQLMLAGF